MRSRTFTLLSMSAIVAVTALSFCGPAAADDRDTCKTASGDTAIAACSRAIASKKYKGNSLSLLHTNRGAEYGAKDDYTRAIADHDQAIKIDPKNALAYNNRGITKLKKGDEDGGKADLARAKELQPGIAQPQQSTQAATPSTSIDH